MGNTLKETALQERNREESGRGDALRAWRAFIECHARLLDLLGHEMRRHHDLPLTWYEVLLHLSRAPKGARRMSELAASLLLSKSGLTRLVDRMETAGLIERTYCSSDRRGTFATLTDEGREVLERAAPDHVEGVRRHFLSHLTPEEQEILASALEKVRDAACSSADTRRAVVTRALAGEAD